MFEKMRRSSKVVVPSDLLKAIEQMTGGHDFSGGRWKPIQETTGINFSGGIRKPIQESPNEKLIGCLVFRLPSETNRKI